MFLATINKPKQLIYLIFIGRVDVGQLKRSRQEMELLLAELSPGFRLVTDLGRLDSIEPECAAEIGAVMELCDQKGISLVVRVIPDPAKDIGFNILALFHYQRLPRVVTCENMSEAAKILSL